VILSLKELVVVLLISIGVFKLVKPIVRLYCPEKDFARRCGAWIILTITVFIAPNFWVFLFVAAPVLVWVGRKDSNPAAAFLFLLFLLPPISVRVPMIGISYLIDLDFHLLLSLCLLAPTAWRLMNQRGPQAPGARILDTLLIAFYLLTSFLFVQPEIARGVLMETTYTDYLRRAVSYFFSFFIPYYVISRSNANRATVQDMIASFSIKCALLGAVAIFEGLRNWLLYGELLSRWGSVAPSYLSRGGALRAMASAGHPLALGYLLAVGFGCWLYLQQGVQSRALRFFVFGLFLFGLLADYSRGPWAGAILIYLAFAALGPQALSRSVKAIVGMLLLGAAVAISPLGTKVASVVPYFGGTVNIDTVIYRQKLFDRSWQIIMDHPWFGDQQALLKMEELRQGEGIIDLVNGFIGILLNNGFVGLSVFLLFIVIGLVKAFRLSSATASTDPDLSRLGACLVACVLGSMLMTWVAGLIDVMTCVLVGLMAAYVEVGRRVAADRRPGRPASKLLQKGI
jgi:O-antigen ligase